jgi:hypothetical protein
VTEFYEVHRTRAGRSVRRAAVRKISAPLCQAALREGACESAVRLLKTASEMRLLRHRSASLRDLPGFHLGFDEPIEVSDLPIQRPDVAQHLRSQSPSEAGRGALGPYAAQDARGSVG